MINDRIKEMTSDELTIVDEEGNEFVFSILFSYENEERNATYVFFYDEEDEDDVMFVRYYEDGKISYVEDAEELAEIEEVFRAFEEELED
ncbi:MAG TPA: DUF1292 domain-containing protein [Bacilli bacterium]|nr:DUF1292 domain-containing protein [Bacilli bacterium]